LIRRTLAIISLLMAIMFLCGACGKKAPPIPRQIGDFCYYPITGWTEGISLGHTRGQDGG
jgi:hypothetical protein